MRAEGPNAEQITYWNEQTGPKWVAGQERLDRMIAPFGDAAMAALGLRSGERVIDVGCGCGDTSLALARQVTASGSVLGVDISEPMLERARDRARHDGCSQAHFLTADAQTHGFDAGAADALFSRFGVMFFAHPTAAFANLGRALRAGGRLAFACWQPVTENPWMFVPIMAAAQVVALPPPPAPDAPGPFAFGDRARVTTILQEAGFHDVAIEGFAPSLTVGGGGDLDEAVRFVLQLGPTAAALRDASPDQLTRVSVAVRDALQPFVTPDGVVMASASWIVTGWR